MCRYLLYEFKGTDTMYLVHENDAEELKAVALHQDSIIKRGEVLLDEPLRPNKRWFAYASQPKAVNPFFLQMKHIGRNADYL